jgi:hypothetical protein
MNRVVQIAALLLGWSVVNVPAHLGPRLAGAAAARGLRDAPASREALIARFLAALAARDREALHRLRVDEDEYVEIILPGSVPPGTPLRVWPDDVRRYFWREFNTKSLYAETHLLEGFGGRHLRSSPSNSREARRDTQTT